MYEARGSRDRGRRDSTGDIYTTVARPSRVRAPCRGAAGPLWCRRNRWGGIDNWRRVPDSRPIDNRGGSLSGCGPARCALSLQHSGQVPPCFTKQASLPIRLQFVHASSRQKQHIDSAEHRDILPEGFACHPLDPIASRSKADVLSGYHHSEPGAGALVSARKNQIVAVGQSVLGSGKNGLEIRRCQQSSRPGERCCIRTPDGHCPLRQTGACGLWPGDVSVPGGLWPLPCAHETRGSACA